MTGGGEKKRNGPPLPSPRLIPLFYVRCVMCGTCCYVSNPSLLRTRKNAGKEVADDPTNLARSLAKSLRAWEGEGFDDNEVPVEGGAVVPNQNKGLCSLCDRAVWLYGRQVRSASGGPCQIVSIDKINSTTPGSTRRAAPLRSPAGHKVVQGLQEL